MTSAAAASREAFEIGVIGPEVLEAGLVQAGTDQLEGDVMAHVLGGHERDALGRRSTAPMLRRR